VIGPSGAVRVLVATRPPGFKSKIHKPDVDYFSLSMKDGAIAKAKKLRDFPSLGQLRIVIEAMPFDTVIERRNRALALTRKNALFAGSDGGAESWAVITENRRTGRGHISVSGLAAVC
jgi:hypothetical protein